MRFKSFEPKFPELFDIRIIRKFLLFPMKLNIGSSSVYQTRWLEYASIRQRWLDFPLTKYPRWVNLGWVVEEKKE